MLSSANYVRETGVLRSGEIFASDIDRETLKDPNTKVYKHLVPGSQFFMPDGAALVFMGGVFITKNPDIIRELDKIANKSGTQVATDDSMLERLRKEIEVAGNDAQLPASEGDVVGGKKLSLSKI